MLFDWMVVGQVLPNNPAHAVRGPKHTQRRGNGFVYLPEQAYWLADFLAEVAVFPTGRHDDQVDSMSQALDWLKKRFSWDDWIQWMEKKGEVSRRRG